MLFSKADREQLERIEGKLDGLAVLGSGARLKLNEIEHKLEIVLSNSAGNGLQITDINLAQGKLLAALNELQADFNQWPGWRNDTEGWLKRIATDGTETRIEHGKTLLKLSGKMDALGNLLGGLLALAEKPPRRAGGRKRK